MKHYMKLNQTLVVNNVIYSPGDTVVIDDDNRAKYLIAQGAAVKIEKPAGEIPVTVNVSVEDNTTVEVQTVKKKKA